VRERLINLIITLTLIITEEKDKDTTQVVFTTIEEVVENNLKAEQIDENISKKIKSDHEGESFEYKSSAYMC
jgi:hypothetical protein